MYLDYNIDQIHLLFNESKRCTFAYICGRKEYISFVQKEKQKKIIFVLVYSTVCSVLCIFTQNLLKEILCQDIGKI
jgi:hypothetical protein